MTELHRDASPTVAQVILDGMPSEDWGVVKEVKEKGVRPLDIVRIDLSQTHTCEQYDRLP